MQTITINLYPDTFPHVSTNSDSISDLLSKCDYDSSIIYSHSDSENSITFMPHTTMQQFIQFLSDSEIMIMEFTTTYDFT